MASINLQGDTSGSISISAPSVAGSNTLTLPATTQTLATQNALGVRNLIINGDMRIDQRNAGSSVSDANGYILDRMQSIYLGSGTARWTAQQSTDAPNGFVNSFQCTVTTADASPSTSFGYSLVGQPIEGFNASNLGFGTASAKTVTLSFWVKSSLTGSFPVLLHNSAANRAYGTTYTITSANTWEQKSVTIAGDTSGTWLTNNGIGVFVRFGGGGGINRSISADSWVSSITTPTNVTGATSVVGTSGATFYITGVQLEVGDTATPFEHRPFDMELARCQRYYWQQVAPVAGTRALAIGTYLTSAYIEWFAQFPVTMRATPSVVSPTVVGGYEIYRNSGADAFDVVLLGSGNTNTAFLYNNAQVSGTAGQAGSVYCNNSSASLAFSAEL